jgi:MATE family multidrug resistance protein
MVNNALMQFIDRAFLAKESMSSLDAVMPASMLSLVFLGLFQAIVAYSGTFVANYHGAGDLRRSVLCYRVGLLLALAFGMLSLFFVPLGGKVFESFSLGGDVVERGRSYYSICMAGGFFLYAQMAVQSFFTGRGKTKAVFVVNLIGNLVNIALDPVLIFGWLGFPALGISGAAYATVAAMFVQWMILSVIAERDIARVSARAEKMCVTACFREMLSLAARVLRFGVPSGAYSTLNLVSFTVFVFYTARVGHLEAAVSNACFAVNYLIFAPIEGFALGAATLVAQAKGAGDSDAARKAGWKTAFMALAATAVLLSATLIFRDGIMEIFAPRDPVDADRFKNLGFTLLVLMAAWQVFEVFDTVICGALKGAGDTSFVMWWMLFVSFALWIPSVALVSRISNTMPLLWGTMIFQVAVLCAGSILRWKLGKWRNIRLSSG